MDEETMVAALSAWRERVAICEVDGGLTRKEAETTATIGVALEFGPDVAFACWRMAGDGE